VSRQLWFLDVYLLGPLKRRNFCPARVYVDRSNQGIIDAVGSLLFTYMQQKSFHFSIIIIFSHLSAVCTTSHKLKLERGKWSYKLQKRPSYLYIKRRAYPCSPQSKGTVDCLKGAKRRNILKYILTHYHFSSILAFAFLTILHAQSFHI
jgi:hypothetical protein